MGEFLTIEDLARRLNLAPKTIRNKMSAGILKRGLHYSTLPGLPTLFNWAAIVDSYPWTEQAKNEGDHQRQPSEPAIEIPMARGGYCMK